MLHLLHPVSLNDSPTLATNPRRRRRFSKAIRAMPNPSMTFEDLKLALSEREGSTTSQQSLSNLTSALCAFQAFLGRDNHHPVGSSLRASFFKLLSGHVSALEAMNKTPRYISNRKSSLKRWRRLVLALDREFAATHAAHTPFQAALQDLFETGHSRKAVATQAAISYASLKRWLAGATPNERTYPSIRRLETFFGLSAGTLLDLVQARATSASSVGTPPVIAYRERLSKAVKGRYGLKEIPAPLRSEWMALLRHKTAPASLALERQKNARWSSSRESPVRQSDTTWHSFIDGKHVPTAGVVWAHISSYLGWMSTYYDPGLETRLTPSLAWLVEPTAVECYVEWKIERAGRVHGGVITFLKLLTSLLHPRTGYLTQQPDFHTLLPASARKAAWEDCCAKGFRYAKDCLESYAEDEHSVSRDPVAPIESVLKLNEPIAALADMTNRMCADRPMTSGTREAIHVRDTLLIKLLTSNPLRAKNLKMMRYAEDNTGNLYRKVDGSWHVRFERRAFKNFRGAAKHRDYDMPVATSVWPDIERYLKVYRPMLVGSTEGFVFVTPSNPAPWVALNRRVEALTKRYLWRCPGVGPHAFRHIIATSILKASPNDWQTAALVLHDRVETVERSYGHLRSADGARRMHELLGETLNRM